MTDMLMGRVGKAAFMSVTDVMAAVAGVDMISECVFYSASSVRDYRER